MDHTPPPLALAVARRLPLPEGRRSVEAFRDGDLEVRMAASPGRGPQVPHDRDEIYIVVAGSGHYRVGNTVTAVGIGDLLFAAAHAPHGFEDCTDDFSVWVIFYGPQKQAPGQRP
jgi:mannose-6-phosphate isomerase-like protein (cupin superfamily)